MCKKESKPEGPRALATHESHPDAIGRRLPRARALPRTSLNWFQRLSPFFRLAGAPPAERNAAEARQPSPFTCVGAPAEVRSRGGLPLRTKPN